MELAFKIAGIGMIINSILLLILLFIKSKGIQSLFVEILSLVFSSSLSTCAIFLLICGNALHKSNFLMVVILIGSLIYLIKTIVNNYIFVDVEVYMDTTPKNDDTPNNTPDE